MVSDGGIAVSQKVVPMMTIQRVRECFAGVLIRERLKVCSPDEYACFRSTQWLNRTKEAIESCRKNQKIELNSFADNG
jgi:hypothetical protein